MILCDLDRSCVFRARSISNYSPPYVCITVTAEKHLMSPSLNKLPIVLEFLTHESLGQIVSSLVVGWNFDDDHEPIWIALRMMDVAPKVMILDIEVLGA